MNDYPNLDHAFDLREAGKLREAYEAFREAAAGAHDALAKAGILLNAASTLTNLGDFNLAKLQLSTVRDLLQFRTGDTDDDSEMEELKGLRIGSYVEEAAISAAQGNRQAALEELSLLLKKYESDLRKISLRDSYEVIQGQRAFLLADGGSFAEALPILEELVASCSQNSSILFYLGYTYMMTGNDDGAHRKLKDAISLGLPSYFEFRAHCALGIVLYRLGDFANAKSELELGAKTANSRYMEEAHIWKWLEYTCRKLGLEDEAERYAGLARPL
jgi:tetratricopeptide (TPR) repeat protein